MRAWRVWSSPPLLPWFSCQIPVSPLCSILQTQHPLVLLEHFSVVLVFACRFLLILQASGHQLINGHFMTALYKSSPINHSLPRPCLFPAGHLGTPEATILSMSVCLFNMCLLTRVYAPPGRALTWFSAAGSEQASDQGLTNKQVNALAGIMIVLNWFPPKGQQDKDLGANGLLRR